MKIFKSTVNKLYPRSVKLGEFLSQLTNLKEPEIFKAATQGAVWIQKNGKGKIQRIRELDQVIDPTDQIHFYYDPKILNLPSLDHLEHLYEDKNFGIWIKPSGIVPQGSEGGDHASVIRYVEKVKDKEVFLVHRLDRETKGIMIVAYHQQAAAYFSDLFQKNKIKKEYEAIVLGQIPVGHTQTISHSLDDKEAITHFKVLDSNSNRSLLRISIETGRLHQIRRHLDSIGHPVMGDPKYGRGNKNRDGLRLLALSLGFFDAWSQEDCFYTLPHGYSLS